MRTGLAYTSARILMLVVSLVVLYLCGARGILLLALAFIVSAILSYILLSKQREKMATALNGRIGRMSSKVSGKATELKDRLDEGTASEDEANDAARADDGTAGTEDGTARADDTEADGLPASAAK